MYQITGNPRSHDERTSGWKLAHQRLSQILIERGELFDTLTPIMKLDAAGTMYQRSVWMLPRATVQISHYRKKRKLVKLQAPQLT
ncbi:protein-disulfide isomerase-like protein with CxxC motif [Pseudomonas sp. F-14 TE3482]